ncbi:unnamed protein product [Linum tenue]|uniref:diaminopimelate epimerase n=1 Tax=Linum tenue TaxID=586396 RepID=A0AAV0PPQ8_9ROSI|nr:unnamed protein product [Linum tenue]
MAIAATISLSVSPTTRHSVAAAFNPFRSSSSTRVSVSFSPALRITSLRSNIPFRNPSFRVSATSMSIQAPQQTSSTSFLDRRESGVLHFVKYHGLGNDFILVDNRDSTEPRISPEQAKKLCDRNFGIGADGVIFALPGTNDTDYTMRIFNSDGSEPEMCGNGVRCFARFIAELENLHGNHSFKVHTGAGLIVPEIQGDGKVRVDMGEPILKAADVPTGLPANKQEAVVKSELDVDGVTWNVTCVSMGNPHCVTFGTIENKGLLVDELNLAEIGPKFEHHVMFPARTNTEFVQVCSPSHLKMRVWERGAGATLACGTGACATVVAAVLEGRAGRKCTVDLPGGPLEIEWREEDNHIYMTGPAESQNQRRVKGAKDREIRDLILELYLLSADVRTNNFRGRPSLTKSKSNWLKVPFSRFTEATESESQPFLLLKWKGSARVLLIASPGSTHRNCFDFGGVGRGSKREKKTMSMSLTPDHFRKSGFGLVPSPAPFLTPRPERRRPESRSSDLSSNRQDRDKEVNVQVLLRCRPLSDEEQRANVPRVISCNEHRREVTVLQSVANKQVDRVFSFDKVFGPKAQQRSIYDQAIAPIVNEVLDGFNCTVFAYGQTGTGKTYTMEGGMRNKGGDLPAEAGVIPRAVRQIFDILEAQNADYSMKVTFLELYNEEITDLLASEDNSRSIDDRQKRPVSLMEDGKGCVVLRGLEEEVVYSANDIYTLLERGAAKRRTADTFLNKHSSRSHSVFSITVHIKESNIGEEELIKCGKLNLVDLAGSENISRSGAREANQKISKTVLLKDLFLEIDRMKEDVRAARERNGVYVPHDRFAQEEAEKKARAQKIEQLEIELNLNEKEVDRFRELYMSEQEEKLEVTSELKDCKVNLEKSNKDLLDLREQYRVAISTLKEKEFIISKLLYSENSLVERAKELRNGLQSASEDITSLFTTLEFEVVADGTGFGTCQATKALESRIRKMADAYSSGIESLKEFANAMKENSSSDLEQLNATISSQVSAIEQLLAVTVSEAQSSVEDIQNSLREQEHILYISTQQQEKGLERSLRHTQVISKATMDFFDDINVQASKVMNVLEESQTKQSDWLNNFHQTFQEQTAREEKQALEDITKILGNMTSRRTAHVMEASRSMQGMRTDEHKKMQQEMSYIHQASSDANKELRRHAEEVKRNFMAHSFSVAESRVVMETVLQECSDKVNRSKEQLENAQSKVSDLNRSSALVVEAAVREKISINNVAQQQFLSASSAVDEEFCGRTVDVMAAVEDSLTRDQESTKEMDAMATLCMNQLKTIQEKHGESIASIRSKADKCLTQDYEVDEDTSSRPERRVISVPSMSSIEKMRMSFPAAANGSVEEEEENVGYRLSSKWSHHHHHQMTESKNPQLVHSSRAPLGDVN